MGCNTGVTSSANQTLASLYCDVLAGLEVPVSLGEAEVDDVDCLAVLAAASHEVVGLDVPVDKPLPMDLLEPGDYLDADIEGGRNREALRAESPEEYHAWKSYSRERSSSSMTMKMRSCYASVP